MNITSKQWFQIVSGIIGSLITAAALLQTLFGQDLTIKIVAVLGIFNIILSSVGTALSGQANLVKDVAAMPGVDSVKINGNASQSVAQVALDPETNKVSPTQAAEQAVQNIAKGS